jgi:hypothetical protein
MAKKKVTREELNTLAAEVNAVLNLENPIKFGKKITDEDLTDAIIAQCKGNVYEIDFIEDDEDPNIPIYSEEMKVVFGSLGIKVEKGSPPALVEEDDDIENVDDSEEDADESEVEEIEPVKKGAAKKDAPVKEVAKSAPAKKAKVEKTYTRWNAFADVVKSGKKMGVDDIATKADALCVKNGKNSNMNESKKTVDLSIKIAVALGHGEFADKSFTYIP